MTIHVPELSIADRGHHADQRATASPTTATPDPDTDDVSQVRQHDTMMAIPGLVQSTSAVTTLDRQGMTLEECRGFDDLFSYLCEIREIDESEYTAIRDRIRNTADSYQAAATQLSLTLPIPRVIRTPDLPVQEARLFSRVVGKLNNNVAPYLSGGSAISLQGGRRPLGDFDFRIDSRPGLVTFGLGRGSTLLTDLNDRGREIARRRGTRKFLGIPFRQRASFTPFAVLGRDVTIGTKDWFGFEVSLTVNDVTLLGSPELNVLNGISLMSLESLFCDKLKTTISRRKPGEEGVKKLAQDLFDVLLIGDLLQRVSNESQLTLEGLLPRLNARLPAYLVNNLERDSMNDELGDEIVNRMFDRLVVLAEIHGEEENRQTAAFRTLAEKYAIDMLGSLTTMRSLYDREKVDPDVEDQIRHKKPTPGHRGDPTALDRGRNIQLARTELQIEQSVSAPDWERLKDFSARAGVRIGTLSEAARTVVLALLRSSSGRVSLDKINDPVETKEAFQLEPAVLKKAFGELKDLEVVELEKTGVRLLLG